MKHIIISLASLFFSLNLLAGPGGGGGGVGTVPTLRMHAEIMNSRHDLLRLNHLEVEALTSRLGDYARLEDIKEGFVHFSGATLRGGHLELKPKARDFEIESIIFIDGSEFEFTDRPRIN